MSGASEALVSPITFWEVAMLVGKSRVALDRPILAWANDVLADPSFALAPMSIDIAVAAGELVGFHGDPHG